MRTKLSPATAARPARPTAVSEEEARPRPSWTILEGGGRTEHIGLAVGERAQLGHNRDASVQHSLGQLLHNLESILGPLNLPDSELGFVHDSARDALDVSSRAIERTANGLFEEVAEATRKQLKAQKQWYEVKLETDPAAKPRGAPRDRADLRGGVERLFNLIRASRCIPYRHRNLNAQR